MDNPRHRKIFGVGFHRTGTTTLHRSLELLGIDTWWFKRSSSPELKAMLNGIDRDDLSPMTRVIDEHQALSDNPFFFPGMHRSLDRLYPGSRYILTRRSSARWLASCKRYFTGKRHTHRTFPMIYGAQNPSVCPAWVETYERHNAAVVEELGDRVLVVDWERGDGWTELCRFLGRPCPDAPFPHLNRSQVELP